MADTSGAGSAGRRTGGVGSPVVPPSTPLTTPATQAPKTVSTIQKTGLPGTPAQTPAAPAKATYKIPIGKGAPPEIRQPILPKPQTVEQRYDRKFETIKQDITTRQVIATNIVRDKYVKGYFDLITGAKGPGNVRNPKAYGNRRTDYEHPYLQGAMDPDTVNILKTQKPAIPAPTSKPLAANTDVKPGAKGVVERLNKSKV